jgi:Family of unknown function (DUF6760)
VPELRDRIRRGAAERGGILGHPLDQLYEEVAFIAYHFNWNLQTILDLEHSDRRQFIEEISSLNERANAESLSA